MYTTRATEGLAKTRRGLTQKVENLESQRELVKRPSAESVAHPSEISSPKPVFHQMNGKQRTSSHRVPYEFNPHHEELVKYISDDWNRVLRDYELNRHQGSDSQSGPTYYQSKSPNTMANFKPFDLEAFWGQRLYNQFIHNT